MTPLIDGDIICHELGWSGEFKDKDTGESVLLDFELVAEMLDKKIELICQDVGATTPPIIYITDSEKLTALINREGRWLGKPLRVYTPNFRYAVAKTQPYKGNRNNPKPFHFYNIIAYLRFNYDVRISDNGYEADDMIVMEQMRTAKEYGCSINTHAGKVLVDYEDWLLWGNTTFIIESNGYAVNDTGKGPTRKVWYLHREIMGNPKGMHVDHINGDKLDNRKYNLRVCTTKENIRNSKAQPGTSLYKGVRYDKDRGKWSSNIKVDKKSIFLGRYDREEDAALSYDNAARKYFKEFAWLNFEKACKKDFKETIICSRDKDLRICPLWHFSWECGKQPSIGPHFTDRIGELSLVRKLDAKGKVKSTELKGYGLKFFYSQMLTGDTADHIPGLSGVGAVAAYNLLNELSSEEEIYEAVKAAYIDKMGDEAKDYFLEQANLLWMIQEVGQHYKPFKKEKHG